MTSFNPTVLLSILGIAIALFEAHRSFANEQNAHERWVQDLRQDVKALDALKTIEDQRAVDAAKLQTTAMRPTASPTTNLEESAQKKNRSKTSAETVTQ
jgi:hypothetical protein